MRAVCIAGNRVAITNAAFCCWCECYSATFEGSHNDAVAGFLCLLFHGQAILFELLKTEAGDTAIIQNVGKYPSNDMRSRSRRPQYSVCNLHASRGRDSSVGIATRNGLDRPVRGSNPGGGEIFRARTDRPWAPPSLP